MYILKALVRIVTLELKIRLILIALLETKGESEQFANENPLNA